MVYKVDTKNKTIEIVKATGEEILELAKEYHNYTFTDILPNTWWIPNNENINIQPYKYPYYATGYSDSSAGTKNINNTVSLTKNS